MGDSFVYNRDTWDVIKAFLTKDNGKYLVQHHISSYNKLITRG